MSDTFVTSIIFSSNKGQAGGIQGRWVAIRA